MACGSLQRGFGDVGICGFRGWARLDFFFRYGLAGFFTVQQNERAVLTSFGRAQGVEKKTTLELPMAEHLSETDRGHRPSFLVHDSAT
jgi:hypothetical protein